MVVVRTRQEAKLRGAANLIANLLLKEDDEAKLSYIELDHYVHCLDQLSSGAIEVLVEAYRAACATRSPDFSEDVRIDFSDIQARMPESGPSLLMGLVGELNAVNILHLTGAPGIVTPGYANYPVFLTPMGVGFVSHVLELVTQGD